MPRILLEENQIAEPVDETTKAAIQIGLDQIARGETVTLDQVRENIKKRSKAWRHVSLNQTES